MNFDEKIQRLKEICKLLSSDSLSLEETAKLYKEGITISDDCLAAVNDIRAELFKDDEVNV